MEKDWMDLSGHSKKYTNGFKLFLEFAFTKGKTQGGEISCPYAICPNNKWENRDIVHIHLICHGFVKGYKEWVNHKEGVTLMDFDADLDDEDKWYDDNNGLLNDVFRDVAQVDGIYEGPNEDA